MLLIALCCFRVRRHGDDSSWAQDEERTHGTVTEDAHMSVVFPSCAAVLLQFYDYDDDYYHHHHHHHAFIFLYT